MFAIGGCAAFVGLAFGVSTLAAGNDDTCGATEEETTATLVVDDEVTETPERVANLPASLGDDTAQADAIARRAAQLQAQVSLCAD